MFYGLASCIEQILIVFTAFATSAENVGFVFYRRERRMACNYLQLPDEMRTATYVQFFQLR